MEQAIDSVVKQIFERLDNDIRDRRGIGNEWEAISEDVMNKYLRPAWCKIISEEISKLHH